MLYNMTDNMSKLFNYMSKPLSLIAIDLIYTSNNIVYERADLYCDFALTLNHLIESTYMGHELTDDIEKINHFNWCWNKASDLVKTSKINFKDNNEGYVYFLDTYLDTFYNEKLINNNYNIKGFIEYTFNYNVTKTRSDLDIFIAIYKIFEKSYEKY